MISLDRATGLGRELAEVADQEILRRRQRTLGTPAHFGSSRSMPLSGSRSKVGAAIDGAALGVAVVAISLLALWWCMQL
jgi:hypothetical protein